MGDNLMATYKKRLTFTASRLRDFLKAFFRSKRGMVGVLILTIFGIIAVGAPLMTPYNPTRDENLAYRLAAPTWLRNFPGYEEINENIKVVPDPGFSSAESLNQWNVTTSPPSKAEAISVTYSSTIGNTLAGGSGPGCLAITFRREQTGAVFKDVTVRISRRFYYPYKSSPGRFSGTIALTATGTGAIAATDKALLDVPATINVFIAVENKSYPLWPHLPPYNPSTLAGENVITPNGTIQTSMSSKWISSVGEAGSPIDSAWPGTIQKIHGGSKTVLTDPCFVVFNRTRIPNTFTYGVEFTFKDTDLAKQDREVETTIYLDDLSLRTYGTSFGLLGTDQLGRDIFTQVLYGTKISLYVGLMVSIFGVAVGLLIGLASGYLGRLADEIMMRFTDMLLVIPALPLLIVLVAVLGATLQNLIILLVLLGWMGFARIVRSQVLSLKERSFIEAAKAVGAGRTHIIIRHILPNVMSLVYVTLAMSVPGAIVTEAALAWLGFYWGPGVTSWGKMLRDVQMTEGATTKWWWVVPPGLCIAAIALAFILIGYALDDILNPKLRVRR